MDPDQARRFVGPDLGPYCLPRLSADKELNGVQTKKTNEAKPSEAVYSVSLWSVQTCLFEWPPYRTQMCLTDRLGQFGLGLHCLHFSRHSF